MFDAFSKAINQLFDPRILRVIGISLVLSIASFALVLTAVIWSLATFDLSSIGWLETTIDWLGGFAAVVLALVLFPPVAVVFLGLFLDSIAKAVEARYYPELGQAPGVSFWQGIGATLRFLALVVVVNIALLFLLLFPPAYPIGYLVANGFLIAREYWDLVALRRMQPREAKALFSRKTGELVLIGMATAFLLTIPIANFVAPVIATAVMVHRFEAWRGLPPPGSLSTPTPPPPPPPA